MHARVVSAGNKGPVGAPGGKPSPFYAMALGPLRELGIAVGLVALVSVARGLLGYLFPGLGVFVLYFPVVLLAALIGGWRSGLAAVALTGAVVLGLFVKPVVSVRLTDPASPGNLALVAVSAAPLVIVGDYVRRLLGRLRLSRDALADRNLQFDALFDSMLEGYALCEAIWSGDGMLIDYTIIEMNPALQRMLGVGPEAIGAKLSDGPGDWTAWLRLCAGVLNTGEPAGFERHEPTTDRWHEIRITRVTDNLMAQIFFDITERKKAEVRQAGLFDELNHRVSNNLTLVSGILHMKARATDNDVVRDQLLRAEARVQSIAQVHRALYRGGRTDQVEFGGYLRDLCNSVEESLTHDDGIAVAVEADRIMLPVDMAIPLGMVVNELVTNAIKYAYPNQARGLIRVHLTGQGDGLRLTVADDGRGLNDGVESRSSGLGMRLVKSLVTQVDGELVVHRQPGATFEITLSQISAR
jgi:two-component sensor histidine kinase/PAS domain-containing protein